MVEQIGRVHPKLEFARLPSWQSPTFGQREIDVVYTGPIQRVSLVLAKGERRRRCVCGWIEPLLDRMRATRTPNQVRVESCCGVTISTIATQRACRLRAGHNNREWTSRIVDDGS